MGTAAVEAYTRHEDATVKLTAIIQANGRNVESVKGSYEKFEEQIDRLTNTSKVQTENLLRQAEARRTDRRESGTGR